MSRESKVRTLYFTRGSADTRNEVTDFRPGEHGARGTDGNSRRMYQKVRLDSGATSATTVGVVAANQLAYWKDKGTFLVTNDRDQALGGGAVANGAYRNFVAGIFRTAVTAGRFCTVLQRGSDIPCADGGNTFVFGEKVIAEDDSAAAVDRLGAATALTVQQIGMAKGAASGGNVNVDVNILPMME